jgi:uncharacterized RDD family membrane protein YckC
MRSEPHLTFETPEQSLASLRLAGLGGRALAWLVDSMVLLLAWVTLLVVWSFGGDLLRRFQALSGAARAAVALLVLASGWLWDVAWETQWQGRTPGKRLLGLRVVRRDGRPAGLVESVLRNAARAVEVPLLYAPGVLCIALTPRHERLGDMLAGTLVVRDRASNLSRYAAPTAEVNAAWPALRGRAARILSHQDLEQLLDFLRRRPGLEPAARSRIAAEAAAGLAARAGLAAPSAPESEAFLEAVAAAASEGVR